MAPRRATRKPAVCQLQVQVEKVWGCRRPEQARLQEEPLALLRRGAREYGAL